jgi:RHS repeat-associated protein
VGRLLHKQVGGIVLEADGERVTQHKSSRYRYDPMGRLIEATTDGGARSVLAYDAVGQLRREEGLGQGARSVVQHRYDVLGNRVQSMLPDGRNLHWRYYGSGHLHQVQVDGHVICDIERDALHRERTRTQGALHSRYEHDGLGRRIAQGTWRGAPDAEGNAEGEGTPGGVDDGWPQAPMVLSRFYDYDRAGNLHAMRDLRYGATRYRYDPLGRLSAALQSGHEARFSFDPAHNLIEASSAHARASAGRVRDNRLEVLGERRFRYDTHGNLIEKKIGRHTTIGLVWDVEHQLRAARVTRNGLSQTFEYRYDAFGRRVAKKDAFGQTLFVWDGNLLLSEARGGRKTLYLYEPHSFIPLAQLSDDDALAPTVAEETAPPATRNEEEDEEAELNWNPREARRRFERQMQRAQRTIRLATRAAASAQPAPRRDLSYEIETQPKRWQTRYYHTDHLGTPRELTDEAGQIVWRARYEAWGNTLSEEWLPEQQTREPNAIPPDPRHAAAQAKKAKALAEQHHLTQNLRFQGQYFDAETGLHYNRFRYYDPDVGRFVSQDPIGLAGGDNSYLYAFNPTGWVDPTGLARCIFYVLGRKVYQDNSIFDGGKPNLSQIDWNALNSPSFDKLKDLLNSGASNKQLMAQGYAPFGYDGKQVNLHHILGEEPGPMVELSGTVHQMYTRQLHGLIKNGESFRNNPKLDRAYTKFRGNYWRERAKDFCG